MENNISSKILEMRLERAQKELADKESRINTLNTEKKALEKELESLKTQIMELKFELRDYKENKSLIIAFITVIGTVLAALINVIGPNFFK